MIIISTTKCFFSTLAMLQKEKEQLFSNYETQSSAEKKVTETNQAWLNFAGSNIKRTLKFHSGQSFYFMLQRVTRLILNPNFDGRNIYSIIVYSQNVHMAAV